MIYNDVVLNQYFTSIISYIAVCYLHNTITWCHHDKKRRKDSDEEETYH